MQLSSGEERGPGSVVHGRVGSVVIARLLGHLHGQGLARFQAELLAAVRSGRTRGVVVDLSSVDLLDRVEFEGLRATARVVGMLGARTVLCGLQPPLVAALVEEDVDVTGLETAGTLEDATALASRGDL